MVRKLKSDIINYGNDSLRIDYDKVKKVDGETYVEVSFVGKDAFYVDNKTDFRLTQSFYGTKEHAQSFVLGAVKAILMKKARGTVEMDYDEVMKLPEGRKIIQITSLGQENIYFKKGGLDYFVKSYKNFDRFETPKWITTTELKRMV